MTHLKTYLINLLFHSNRPLTLDDFYEDFMWTDIVIEERNLQGALLSLSPKFVTVTKKIRWRTVSLTKFRKDDLLESDYALYFSCPLKELRVPANFHEERYKAYLREHCAEKKLIIVRDDDEWFVLRKFD